MPPRAITRDISVAPFVCGKAYKPFTLTSLTFRITLQVLEPELIGGRGLINFLDGPTGLLGLAKEKRIWACDFRVFRPTEPLVLDPRLFPTAGEPFNFTCATASHASP